LRHCSINISKHIVLGGITSPAPPAPAIMNNMALSPKDNFSNPSMKPSQLEKEWWYPF
jgi:hypothetical protein